MSPQSAPSGKGVKITANTTTPTIITARPRAVSRMRRERGDTSANIADRWAFVNAANAVDLGARQTTVCGTGRSVGRFRFVAQAALSMRLMLAAQSWSLGCAAHVGVDGERSREHGRSESEVRLRPRWYVSPSPPAGTVARPRRGFRLSSGGSVARF
jgi:hypothetical protein